MTLLIARQTSLVRPGFDLQRTAIGPSVAVLAVAVRLLQERLELRLQLVLKDDAMDLRASLMQPLGLFEVGTVDRGVVLQLAWSLDAVVECLSVRRVLITAMAFEQFATFLRQRDCGRVAVEAGGLDQAGLAQAPQLAVTRVEGLAEGVAQVAGSDDAEGADGRQRAALGAAQHVAAVADPDVLTFASTGQANVVREHVAWLQTSPLANIGATAASAAAQLS